MTQPRMCPLLTIMAIKAPEPKRLVAIADKAPTEPQGFDAVPCAGNMCAWWQPVYDDRGKPIGGNCAMALMPTAVAMLNGTLREAAALNKKDGN